MASPDPFDASLAVAPAPTAPAKAPPGPMDAFAASLGASGAPLATGASGVPLKPGADLGAGSAFAGGVVSGLPIVGPWVKRNLDEGVAHLRSWSSGKSVDEERQNIAAQSGATDTAHPTAAGAGEITGQVAGFGAMAAAAPAAFGLAASSLPEAAITSGVTNALISGADAYARGEDPTKASISGGVVGMGAPVIGAAVGRLFSNYIQPEVARLADLAINRFGIPLGPDLISTNPMVRFASSVMDKMPLTGGGAAKEARQVAFNRAVAQQFGENADSLVPAVMNRARARIGQDFEYAAANTPQIGADQQFGNDLTRIWQDINQPVDRALTGDERNVVEGHLRRVLDLFNRGNGSITGQQFQQLTRKGTALDRATESTNPNIRHYGIQIEGALRDAMLRFAPPDAAETLQQARQQWWALKTVEDLAEISPTGNVSPARLMGQVRQGANNVAYGGGGDLAELARIGQLFLKEPPSSGTAERGLIMKTISELASVGGLWALFHHPLGAVVGAGLPVALGQVGRMARSPRIGNALVNAAVGNPGPITRAVQAGGRGGRYVLPGLVQQARPLVEQYLPNNDGRGNPAQ